MQKLLFRGRWRNWLARGTHNALVVGSSPTRPTISWWGAIDQWLGREIVASARSNRALPAILTWRKWSVIGITPDSKSGSPQGREGSSPSSSAKNIFLGVVQSRSTPRLGRGGRWGGASHLDHLEEWFDEPLDLEGPPRATGLFRDFLASRDAK